MKKENIKLFVPLVGFFLSFSLVFAQADLGVAAGLTPKSAFYFFDQWGEWIAIRLTFNPVRRAERKLQYASERLAELKELKDTERLDKESAEEIKDDFQELSEDVDSDVGELKSQGRDVAELVKKFEDLSSRHVDVLEDVLEKVPEQAKDAIEHALEVSKRGHERAIEAILKEVKEGKIKKEELEEEAKKEVEELEKEEEVEIEEIEEEEGIEKRTGEIKGLNLGGLEEEIEKSIIDIDKDELGDLDSDLNSLEKGLK